MKTARFKVLPALVMFEFSSDNALLRKHLLSAILDGTIPDFECALGSPSGTGNSYTALWLAEHTEVVLAWAQATGLRISTPVGAPSLPRHEETVHSQLPDVGDIAPGGVGAPCLANADAERWKSGRPRKRKRCPACNQLLHILNADGSIESHMRLASFGGNPVLCTQQPERVLGKGKKR